MWPPTVTPCVCEQPGWCERHRCFKTWPLHLLCRRQMAYYEAWEAGQGPCVETMEEPAEPSSETIIGEAAQGPGWGRRMVNFGRAVLRHAGDGLQAVDDAVYEQRLAICRECPMCDQAKMVCHDQSCGCFLNLKARWASEDCPQKKWPQPDSE